MAELAAREMKAEPSPEGVEVEAEAELPDALSTSTAEAGDKPAEE